MINQLLVKTGLILFIVTNIIITLFMTYKSFQLVIRKCLCTTTNLYWIGILTYFLLNLYFFGYTIAIELKYIENTYYKYHFVAYILLTLAFMFGVSNYIKSLKDSDCNCVDDDYKKMLQLIVAMRYIGTVLTIWGFAFWIGYVMLTK